MSFGLDNAISEVTLALFTTLAPAGAIACAVLCVVMLLPALDDECRERISHCLWIPILVALVGLVASATHLGNPANALYVLTGVGRSPLSNEVCVAIVAFGLAGSYWLMSFSMKRFPRLERIWLVAIVCAALVFTASLAFAYDVETIITWALPTMPANLVLNGFVAGPLIALVVLVVAEGLNPQREPAEEQGDGEEGASEGQGVRDVSASFAETVDNSTHTGENVAAMYNLRFARGLMVVAAVALVANVVCYLIQGSLALGLANSTLSVQGLVPHYYLCTAAFALLAATAVVLDLLAVFHDGRLALPRGIGAALLALVAVFIMRFVFYMMHLTVGISL